MKETVSHQ